METGYILRILVALSPKEMEPPNYVFSIFACIGFILSFIPFAWHFKCNFFFLSFFVVFEYRNLFDCYRSTEHGHLSLHGVDRFGLFKQLHQFYCLEQRCRQPIAGLV